MINCSGQIAVFSTHCTKLRREKIKMQYILHHSSANPRNSEGSFVELADGRIYFAYSCYYGDDSFDDCPAHICAITSTDGGGSWSKPVIAVRNSKSNVMSVSLLRLADGRIAMLYLEKSEIPEYGQKECRPQIVFSDDECSTWSSPVDIAGVPAVYFVGNNDRLIQLRSGRLLMPFSHHLYLPDGRLGDGIGVFYYSDDNGATWKRSADTVYPPTGMERGLMEPGVIELEDGSVYCWFRTAAGCQYKTKSYDGGIHWSAAVPAPEFRSPNSPLSMKRDAASGIIYAVWNCHHPMFSVPQTSSKWGYRTPLVIARSKDDCQTWDDHFAVETSPDHGYAYTAMFFRKEKLFLAYCCGGEPDCIRMLQDCRINILDTSIFDGKVFKEDHTAANDPGGRR